VGFKQGLLFIGERYLRRESFQHVRSLAVTAVSRVGDFHLKSPSSGFAQYWGKVLAATVLLLIAVGFFGFEIGEIVVVWPPEKNRAGVGRSN
jgi:hypothetical protein